MLVDAARSSPSCDGLPDRRDALSARSTPATRGTDDDLDVRHHHDHDVDHTTRPGITVPNVIGLKIAAARHALHAVGLPTVGLNLPCNKGTLASQSVVASLSVAGKPPNPAVGATPLKPGATVPPGTRVGITWSGCYGDRSVVPPSWA